MSVSYSVGEQLFLVGFCSVLLFFVRVFMITYRYFMNEYSIGYKLVTGVWWLLHLVQYVFYWAFLLCIFYNGDHMMTGILWIPVILIIAPLDLGFGDLLSGTMVKNIKKFVKNG